LRIWTGLAREDEEVSADSIALIDECKCTERNP
jgi:hypothetical protein